MVNDCHRSTEHRFRRLGRHALLPGLLTAVALAAVVSAEPDSPAPAGGGSTGRIQGSIVVGPRLSAKKIRFNLYSDIAQPATAPHPETEGSELRNVVVYFEPAQALAGAPAPHPARPVMRQEGLTFSPHILAIPRGTTVDFPNGDAIFHNVFSLSKAASFDLGRYPKGTSKSVRFDKTGLVKVFCHIHSDMSGVILVLDNPFFTVPDARGRYSIGGVPAGEYRVVAWHERARPLRKTVRIQPGKAASVDFTIPLTEETAGGD